MHWTIYVYCKHLLPFIIHFIFVDFILVNPAVTKCPAGQKFVPQNGQVAAKCQACTGTTFNDKDDNSEVCTEHNKCTDAGGVKTPGTDKTDAVCNEGMWIYIH